MDNTLTDIRVAIARIEERQIAALDALTIQRDEHQKLHDVIEERLDNIEGIHRKVVGTALMGALSGSSLVSSGVVGTFMKKLGITG
jgi:hypothetical protein